MHHLHERKHGMNPIGVLYVANFILSFHLFFVIYQNSSFLDSLFQALPADSLLTAFQGEQLVSVIYIVSAIIGGLLLLYIAELLRHFGVYRILIAVTVIEIMCFLAFALLDQIWIILALFTLYLMNFPILTYTLDILLESLTKKEDETGTIRGTFLTITNIALILAPLVAGFVLTDGDFWKIYILATLFLLPFLFVMRYFRDFKDPPYHKLELRRTASCIARNRDLRNVFMAHFLMRVFFAWMVIYMPIYLTQVIGFSWAEFGVMTFIFLIPFALVEIPAGKLADSTLGEKELMSLGFLIAGLFVGLASFADNHVVLYWTALLFMSRVGISLVEITTESYFFKHVDGDDNNTISFFRAIRSLAYVIGPALAFIALAFLSMQYLWLVLGLIMLTGLYYSMTLRDTR